MLNGEEGYLGLLQEILDLAKKKDDRTGVGTISVFGRQLRYDISESFPLFTTKKVHFRSVAIELLWFLAGRTDNQYLEENGVKIWKEWSTAEQCAKFGRKEGDLGPIYGHQWRNFGHVPAQNYAMGSEWVHNDEIPGFDQITWLINEIKKNPNSRRLIVTGWNPKEQGQVCLPPCHTLFQFYVREGYEVVDPDNGSPAFTQKVRYLDCQLYQRSADMFLGVPFNVASYSLLTYLVAQVTGLKPGEFIHTFGDAHIYLNHFDAVKTQLSRPTKALPTLEINKEVSDIYSFKLEDFKVLNYDPHPAIKAEVAV